MSGEAGQCYHAEYAWVGGGVARDVRIDVADGRVTAVVPGSPPPPGATRLTGLTLPGFANAHSHAFHRALRGRAQGPGTFWSWRERMYDLAGRLDPDQYYALARATYAEMALAGVTCVGEFHYLHHPPDGEDYDDPNEMAHSLVVAAAEAGIRITLLDTLYLTSTVDGGALVGPQRRFGDGSIDAWARRVALLPDPPHLRTGVAAHSVRAVPAPLLPEVVAVAAGRPLHVHLSEQPAENEACLARYGRTPTQLLAEAGALGPTTTAVHATHLSDVDITLLGQSGTTVCLCPTTERDLADGIGPGRALADAGSPLSLGSDSHAVIDLLEEARAVELDERLRSQRRGHFAVADLIDAATRHGHAALGWPDAGSIAVGARADLVTVRLDTVRTAGYDDPAGAVLFAATVADVTDVVVDGRPIVHNGRHLFVEDVPGALASAIQAVWS
ncbi:MAG: formimidoylglutamate deiminase [Micromonosporaceae bacterium]|nr:formimidoylglutamate deiminase [Micromonosporaceae bacterium]